MLAVTGISNREELMHSTNVVSYVVSYVVSWSMQQVESGAATVAGVGSPVFTMLGFDPNQGIFGKTKQLALH